MSTVSELVDQALSLPRTDRGYLARKLIESLDEEPEEKLSPQWRAELDRRLRSVKDGTAKTIPHDQVMTEVREQLRNLPPSKQTA